MEHRIILEGEIYLPFARSRIKALRATGLRYVSQQFEINGCSVKVRIEPDHEYITLSGTSWVLTMDSGIADIGVTYTESPLSFLPGTLYETGGVSAYNAPFVPTTPPGEWRARADNGRAGQLSGEVVASSSKFIGKVPYDARTAESFASAWVDSGATPPAKIRDPADAKLQAKKLAAVSCPPSVFTGKCRLWVQAMFGQPLHTEDEDTSNPPYLGSLPGSSATPSLRVAAYRRKGDITEYPDIDITTSTGVYLDRETGKHWMFFVGYSSFTVMPLVSNSKRVELLRPFLASAGGGERGSRLNSEDREHLEAYILAGCRPDAKLAVGLPLGGEIPGFSMGYGWHWNWSGTTADIITHSGRAPVTGYPFGTDPMLMISTHHRLTVSHSKGTFSLALQAVEGPVEWVTDRVHWCILMPNWATGGSTKLTHKYPVELVGCEAPFYVFYKRDELQVCRIKMEQTVNPSKRVAPDGFAGGAPFSSVDAWTVGMRGGSCEDTYESTYFSGTISVGAWSSGKTDKSHAVAGSRTVVGAKTRVGGDWSVGWSYPWGPSPTYYAGYPPHEITITAGASYTNECATVTWDFEWGATSRWNSSVSAVVVPTFDAEAIYTHVVAYHTEQWEGVSYHTDTNNLSSTWFMERQRNVKTAIFDGVDQTTEYIKYGWNTSWPKDGYNTTTSTFAKDTGVVIDRDETLLLHKGGGNPTGFGSLDQIINNAVDDIPSSYIVMTGTGTGGDIAIYAPGTVGGNFINAGATPSAATPVFVGWE